MQKMVKIDALEKSIAKFEALMDEEGESPEILTDLSPRELEISTTAYNLGFDRGVNRGIYETLKSFRADLVRTMAADGDVADNSYDPTP